MAGATVAKLNIHLGANTGALSGDLAKAQRMLSGFTAQANTGGGFGGIGGILSAGLKGAGSGGLMGSLSGLAAATGPVALGIAGITAAVAGASWATKLASDAEQMSVSFRVMLGSAEAAEEMLTDIKQFALESPFDTAGLTQNAQTLMQFGIEGKKVVPVLEMLGDISLGDADRMGRLTLAFGQMSSAGRLTGQDLLQMINSGFNPLQEISRITGRSMADLKKDMEAGAISTEMVTAAFQSATSEGGRFHGMMKAQTDTLKGQWSKFVENLQQAFLPAGKVILGMLKELLQAINAGLEAWNKFWGNTPDNNGKKKVLPKIDKSIFDSLGKDSPEKVAAEAAKAAAKALEDLQKQGESLAKSLRTPFERITDELTNAKFLWESGVITGETYARAMAKASEEMRDQVRSADEIRNRLRQQISGPVAAMQFGSQAAATAISNARTEAKLQIEIDKALLVESKKHSELMKKLVDAANNNKPLQPKEVRF